MAVSKNYLDYAGLQRFKTNLDALYASLYRTQAQVDTQIQNKLDTYSTNLVTVQSTKPTVQDAVEGRIYVVPDTNGESGELQFIAYTKEKVNGQDEIITIGHSRVIIPPVSQTVTAGDKAGVSGGAVYTFVTTGYVNKTDDVTSSVTSGDTKVVTSDGVYTELTTNYVAKDDVADTVTASDDSAVSGDAVYNFAVAKTDVSTTVQDNDSKVVTGDAVFEFAVAKTDVTDTVSDGETKVVTGEAVYEYAVAKTDVSTTVQDNDSKVVTGDAVYEFVSSQIGNIQAIPNPEIDVMFMPSTEIWIDSTGWPTMKAKYEASGEFVPLTKNSSGYYVIVPGDVASVDTLVLATSDDSISTGALTDVTSASDLAGFNGKIVAAEDQATTLTVLA